MIFRKLEKNMETRTLATQTVKTKDGREFVFMGEEPYQRKDRSITTLKIWSSACVKCGEAFTIRTPHNTTLAEHSSAFGAKHCQAHKLTADEVRARGIAAIAKARIGVTA
jgi:hypothetical protein